MLYDITHYEGAINFLKEFTQKTQDEIEGYLEKSHEDYNIYSFLEELKIDVNELCIKDLNVAILHVTTNSDENISIKRYGIVNLQQSLTLNTPLKRFLESGKIGFDITNHIMWCRDEAIDITYSNRCLSIDGYDDKLNRIAHKIYEDYQINGFFYSKDALNYGGGIARRPEIIYNIKEFIGRSNIEEAWQEKAKTYLIKFIVPVDQLMWWSVYESKDEYIEDRSCKEQLKYQLINKALGVIWNIYYDSYPSDYYAYLKPEVIVPYENIIEINEA